MRRLLFLVLVTCGGASTTGGGAKDAHRTDAGHENESIADIAGREGLGSLSGPAQTGGSSASLRLEMVDKDNPIRLDGLVKDWTLVPARTVAKGTADSIGFKCGLAYDAQHVFFAGDVSGPTLRHLRRFTDDEDHASLVVVTPGSAPVEITFFAGKPGEMSGVVRIHGRDVPGAKIVEAEGDKGYTFEAQVPWSALTPPGVRVGLRGVARFHDGTRAILATGSGDAQSPHDLPAIPTEPEEALTEQLLAPKGLLAATPKFDLLADLRGDAMKERVAVYDRYLTVVGPNYRGGKEFFYRDLGGDIESLEARDLTGRGKQDLVLRRKLGGADTREWLDVWAFLEDEPTTVFSHEVSVTVGSSHVTNAVRLRSKEIEVTYEPAVGFDATSYKQPRAVDTEPLLLPWGPVKSQTFRFDGSKFVKAKEVAQAGAVPQAASTPGVVATTTTVAEQHAPAVELHAPTPDQLLARYRSDRGVPPATRPRVDLGFAGNHALLIGRDIVVYGPSYKGGTSYAYLTLSQFADAGDIQEMTVREPYLVVRGLRHVNAQAAGTFDLEMMFLYTLRNDVIGGCSASRRRARKAASASRGACSSCRRVAASTSSPTRGARKAGRTRRIPSRRDQPGAGSVEPLLLPWGGIDQLRYSDNGTSFVKTP